MQAILGTLVFAASVMILAIMCWVATIFLFSLV
jgi:hypothetical protein